MPDVAPHRNADRNASGRQYSTRRRVHRTRLGCYFRRRRRAHAQDQPVRPSYGAPVLWRARRHGYQQCDRAVFLDCTHANRREWLILGSTGITSTVGHLLVNSAYKHAEASLLAPSIFKSFRQRQWVACVRPTPRWPERYRNCHHMYGWHGNRLHRALPRTSRRTRNIRSARLSSTDQRRS